MAAVDLTTIKPPLMRKISTGLSEIFETLSVKLENIFDPIDLDQNSCSMFINCASQSPTVMSLRAEKIELMQEIATLASKNVDQKDEDVKEELSSANAMIKHAGGIIDKLYGEKKRLEAMVELAQETEINQDEDAEKLTTVENSRIYAEEVTRLLREENGMLRNSIEMLKTKNPCKWWSLKATKEWVARYAELREENNELKKWRACMKLMKENHDEVESFLDTLLCKVCFEEPIATLLPCGHACLCYDCAKSIANEGNSKCPLCRGKFKKIRKIKI